MSLQFVRSSNKDVGVCYNKKTKQTNKKMVLLE